MIVVILLFIVSGAMAWVFRPGKGIPDSRKIAILASLIPPAAVAVASIVFQVLQYASGEIEVSEISNALFIAGLGLIGAAILTFAGFAIARKGEIVKGIAFGIGIAVMLSIIVFGVLEWLGGV